jgi:hypothetical protein
VDSATAGDHHGHGSGVGDTRESALDCAASQIFACDDDGMPAMLSSTIRLSGRFGKRGRDRRPQRGVAP